MPGELLFVCARYVALLTSLYNHYTFNKPLRFVINEGGSNESRSCHARATCLFFFVFFSLPCVREEEDPAREWGRIPLEARDHDRLSSQTMFAFILFFCLPRNAVDIIVRQKEYSTYTCGGDLVLYNSARYPRSREFIDCHDAE